MSENCEMFEMNISKTFLSLLMQEFLGFRHLGGIFDALGDSNDSQTYEKVLEGTLKLKFTIFGHYRRDG